MTRVTSVTQLPGALQAAKRAKVGVLEIQKDGVWVLSNDPADIWKILAIIGGFGLFGAFVWWLPGDDHTPPTWFLTVWTLCGIAFSAVCFWAAWYLRGDNIIAARIDPNADSVIFSPRRGKRPVRVPISRCFVQISQEVTTESPVARAGMPLGKNFPEFVNLMIGTGMTPGRDQQQATAGVHLPYVEVADGLAPLLALGPWAGVVMTDAHSALREVVMTQVRRCAGSTPIFIPRRAAECMFIHAPYRVYDP